MCLRRTLEGHRLHGLDYRRLAPGERQQLVELRPAAPNAVHERRLVGVGAEAPRNPPAEESDDDHQAALAHRARGLGQGDVGADEIQHDVGRRDPVAGIDGLMRPDLVGGGPLGRRDVRSHDRGFAEQPQVADGELPQPAGADHRGPSPAAAVPQQFQRVPDGAVGGQPAARERGRGDRIQVAEGRKVAGLPHVHPLGVAAVGEDARLGRVGADHLQLGTAVGAVAASPRGVDHHRSQPGVHAGHLVSENPR